MPRSTSGSGSRLWRRQLKVAGAAALLALPIQAAHADEGGDSFWLPGLFGSLGGAPVTPGWSLATIYYHTSVSAFGQCCSSERNPDRQILSNR